MKVPIIACLLAVLLGACAAAPATRFYTLSPVPSVDRLAGSGQGTVVVREVMIPRYLDRPQIVTRIDAHRLHFAEQAQWGGDLREDLTRVLADNLARRSAGSRVLAAPLAVPVAEAVRLDVELLRFEAEAGQVRLAARWWVTDASGRVASRLHAAELAHPVPAGVADGALVAAMSEVYGALADAIAASLREAGR